MAQTLRISSELIALSCREQPQVHRRRRWMSCSTHVPRHGVLGSNRDGASVVSRLKARL